MNRSEKLLCLLFSGGETMNTIAYLMTLQFIFLSFVIPILQHLSIIIYIFECDIVVRVNRSISLSLKIYVSVIKVYRNSSTIGCYLTISFFIKVFEIWCYIGSYPYGHSSGPFFIFKVLSYTLKHLIAQGITNSNEVR